jgi:potassium channel LctB
VRLLEALANSSFGAMLVVWLALVLGCGLVYWLLGLWEVSLVEGGAQVPATLEGLGTAIYFSFVTATSVGYGDVAPVGLARALAATESAAGLVVFGCVISKLVSRRQELLVEEIHDVAFEDRLGRVRTNLHLVLSELQNLSGEGVPDALLPERALPRLESVAVIFAGELRAIRDLLYRPHQAPEEAILETILAILAAGLEGLRDLLHRLPAARERSPTLGATVRSITSLAGEICSDCVPRAYALGMRTWMDRIHGLSRVLEPAPAPGGARGA